MTRIHTTRIFLAGALALVALWPAHAGAALTIEITRMAEAGMPIAVVPFGWKAPRPVAGQPAAEMPVDLAAIVGADLARSGRFQVLPRKDYVSSPTEDKAVVFKEWRLLKSEALVIGGVELVAPGRYQVQFRLYDVLREQQLAGFRYTVGAELLRQVAHQIADIVHEKLTGEPGAFNTRIAYITREEAASATDPTSGRMSEANRNSLSSRGQPPVYKLQVADSDGFAPQTIVKSGEPLLSPAWSPDGKQVAYVSFEDKRSKVYVQSLITGQRELMAEFRGINSAPAWSPDGKRLAVTLSREGNPEIFVLDLATRTLRRLTQNPAIDTEPSWSPDGKQLVFTSDRAGTPQIYRVSAEGGTAERLTFEGDYNARPSYAPDGKSLTLVSGYKGQYHIAVLRLETQALQVLTDTLLDESPSFAPNGRMILYATEMRGHGVLASVSAEGRTRQLYRFEQGDVREPAWSPYNRDLQYIAPTGAKE